jgi:hypothetical protein
LLYFSGNETAENEEIKYLLPTINNNDNPSETVVVVDSDEDLSFESSEKDEKTLLPILALKPLVIAGGLLAGNKFSKKKPSTQANRPSTQVNQPAAPLPENNILVSISNDEQAQIIEEEARKLLLPLLALKPLLFASLVAGSKLPAITIPSIPSIPKPGIGFTITKHESAKNPTETTSTAPTTTTTSTQTPPSNSTSIPPTNNSMNLFFI